jgi:hypothetical protein
MIESEEALLPARMMQRVKSSNLILKKVRVSMMSEHLPVSLSHTLSHFSSPSPYIPIFPLFSPVLMHPLSLTPSPPSPISQSFPLPLSQSISRSLIARKIFHKRAPTVFSSGGVDLLTRAAKDQREGSSRGYQGLGKGGVCM